MITSFVAIELVLELSDAPSYILYPVFAMYFFRGITCFNHLWLCAVNVMLQLHFTLQC